MLKMKRTSKKNVIVYTAIFIMLVTTKVLYIKSNADQLLFILNPVAKIAGLALNTPFEYLENMGYYNKGFGVLISKECSGFNYFIVMFSMLLLFAINRFKKQRSKALFIIFSVAITYVITIIANASRIITSVYVMRLINASNTKFYNIVHQSIGITIYITYLIGVNIVIQYIWGRWGEGNEEII